jgi:hypothetical protein
VSGLVTRWDDRVIERIAAMNLFLDRSMERRREDFVRVREQLGACRADDRFEFVENALRGDWLLQCDRGRARASVTLAPTMPPTVQYLDLSVVPPAQAPGAARPRPCGER